jgi:hypothetical protein
MSAVSSTYICMAKEGLQLSQSIAYPIGIVFAVALFGFYLSIALKHKDNG